MQETQWNYLVMMEVKKHIAVVAVVVVGVMEILMFQMSMNNNKQHLSMHINLLGCCLTFISWLYSLVTSLLNLLLILKAI